MRILVSGSGGLIGSALRPVLEGAGHTVTGLARGQTDGLEGADAVVHLAGESVADGRWTEAKKARIRDSRVSGTRALAAALAALEHPPAVLLCASAIGYYGNRGDEILRESSAPGLGFLAGVCRDWEQAAQSAALRGIRVVNLRFGVVLSASGGALAKMLTPFRMGAGGPVGSGRQWCSWISIDDAVRAAAWALTRDGLAGPVNVVGPRAVTNLEFAQTLGRVLSRPARLALPAAVARALFGEMADDLLLSSARVEPARLAEKGFEFRHNLLEDALRYLLATNELERRRGNFIA